MIRTALIVGLALIFLGNDAWGAAVTRRGASPSDNSVSIKSGKLNLAFRVSAGKASLQEISGPDGTNWITSVPGDRPIWRIAFLAPNGSSLETTNIDSQLVRSAVGRNKIDLIWNAKLGQATSQVGITIRCMPNDPISYWSLHAHLPAGWRVSHAEFPLIPDIGLRKGMRMAAPFGWGLEYDVTPGMSYDGTYPSARATMQFLAFYDGKQGLYVGTHDSQGNHKYFSARAGAGTASLTFTNWPALPKNPGGVYQLPYTAAVGVFTGGYFEAAQIYRTFGLGAPWSKAGPVSGRSIPQWLKETDLWLVPAAEPMKNVEQCKKAADYFGVSTALHWYNWHQIPFDTLYPDYFPAKPQFAEGVKAFQDLGLRVMPYINGRLADANSKTWAERGLQNAAAKQSNGDMYTEIYASKVPLHPVCPTTPVWQQTVVRLVDELVTTYGVDGVYIDQVCAAAPVRCFDPGHPHAAGGGHFWVDGYRTMLREVRAVLPRDTMITTEENAECWLDQFDALLMVNTPTGAARPIPLFPSVYSGRALTFGFQYIVPSDLSLSIPFRAKMARAFLWGSQLGWVSVGQIMDAAATKEAEYLRDLARARRYGRQFLTYGRFLGSLDVLGPNPHVTCEAAGSFGGKYTIDLPSVMASAWQAEDGTVGVIVTNISDYAYDVRVPIAIARTSIRTADGYTMRVYGSDGVGPTVKSTDPTQRITVPARSGLVISISSK